MKINLIAFAMAVGILAVLGYGLKVGLTPRDLSKEDPRSAFESFVCSPPPQTVHEIKASGIVAFAGGHAVIEFQIEPQDHDDLIQRGRFRLAGDKEDQWIKDFQPDGVTGKIVRYVRTNEGMTQTALFLTEDHRRAWFHEIQF
jgi:hypothetical protein